MSRFLEPNDPKAIKINNWIETLPESQYIDKLELIEIIPTDAGSIEYFRIKSNSTANIHSWIVMYSEIKDTVGMIKFKNMSILFQKAKIKTPIIYAEDLELGFFLLEDFGDNLYYILVKNDPAIIDIKYKEAIDNIIKLQLISEPNIVPNFDFEIIVRELSFFKDWYLKVYLNYECTNIDNEDIKKVFYHNNMYLCIVIIIQKI